jgi:hypothetical protein
MHRLLLLTASCLAASALQAQTPSRFSGGATLAGPASISADARFELDAAAFPPGTQSSEEKKSPTNAAPVYSAPKASEQQGGRFGLTAALDNPNAPRVACTTGGNDIFKNGFE